MKTQLKPRYTPAEVIRWLKKNYKKGAKFSYYNNNDFLPCLFSRFLRSATGRKDIYVCRAGDVKENGNASYVGTNTIPFHDCFWDVAVSREVTKEEAIIFLEFLQVKCPHFNQP